MERQSTRKLFKLVIALAALFTLALSVFAFGACGGEEQQNTQQPETHTHKYVSSGTKTDPTCGAIGVETFTCSCGDTYQIITPATGKHTWDTDGKYCTKCGLPNFGADGIDYSKIPDSFTADDLAAIQKAITDSQKGITDAQAEAHKKYDETLKELGGKVDGIQSSVEDVQGSIAALETLHKFDKTGAVKELTLEGTCTTYGVKFTLSTCDICGATFLTGIAKDAEVTGHQYVKDAARSKAPVCGIPGVDVFECSVCKDTYSVSVMPENPALTHQIDESSKQVVIEATCQHTGLVYYTCSKCGVTVSQATPKTGHQADTSKDKTLVPATCLTDGTVEHTCKNCDAKYTETIKALGHQQAEKPIIYDCTYNSPLNGYYCTREGCDNEYVAESVLREALKEGEEVKFHQPLKHLTDAEFETNYKKAAHEYEYGNFSQGELCGSDASYTIKCPNCHAFTDHGKFTITAEYWFKNGVKDWDPDFTAFLFKTEGSDYEDREGDAYRPAHTHDPAATLQVEYVLREFVSDVEWNSLNPINDGPNKHNVMKTAYYACKDCDFANDAEDGSVIKDALAEENAVPEVYKDLMEKKSERHTMAVLWTDTTSTDATTKAFLDALKAQLAGKICKEGDVSFTGTDWATGTLNVHDDRFVTWYCTDSTCNNGHPATYTQEYKWDGTHTWSAEDWKQGWTATDAENAHWELVEGTEVEDTCTVGVWTRYCTVCGEDEVETNPVAPRHEFAHDETYEVTPATCTTNGKESGKCVNCGQTMEDVVIPATGHNFNYESEDEGWITVTPAGHGNKGLEKRPCLTCHGELEGGWQPREIPETNAHTWETNPDGSTKVYVTCEPSCNANGTGYWLCKECGAQLSVGIPALGHWYYDVSREQAATMSPDALHKMLHVVKENESDCLSPNSVTVACVNCGVRYAYGTGEGVKGHEWLVIKDSVNANILCGHFLSEKPLAYCAHCGLVIDLTDKDWKYTEDEEDNELAITFTGAKTYVSYIKDIPAGLSEFVDTNGNLYIGVDENGEPINPLAITAVLMAYETDEIQMHLFVDKHENRIYLLKGNCSTPEAYIVVCSRCGLEDDVPTIKADKDMATATGEAYKQIVFAFRDSYEGGVQAAYDKLGYNNFNKAFLENYTVKVEALGDTEAKEYTNQDLFRALVAMYLTENDLTDAAAEFENVKNNVRYSGFNFAKFTFASNGHDLLTANKDCEIDPLLTMLVEDFAGTTGKGKLWTNNGRTFIGPTGYYGSAFTDRKEGVWKTFGEVLTEQAEKDDRLAQTYGDIEWLDTKWAKVSFGEYAAVIDYLQTLNYNDQTALQAIINADGYLGFSNWCKRAPTPGVCNLTYGLVQTIEHENTYRVLQNPIEPDSFYTEENNTDVYFTLEAGFPTGELTAELAAKWATDLQFIQYLIDNKITDSHPILGSYAKKYKTLIDVDANGHVPSVLNGGEPTCAVVLTCKRCGLDQRGGNHMTNIDDKVYGANCRRGPRCLVCGQIVGAKSNHNLQDVTKLTGSLLAAWEKLNGTDGTDPFSAIPTEATVVGAECWKKGSTSAYKKVEVCVGCLEGYAAGETITWTSGTNYTIQSASEGGDLTANHIYELNETTAKTLIEKFPELFTDIDATTASGADMIAAVKKAIGKLTFTMTKPDADKFTVAVSEDNKLVLHYVQAQDYSVCVGEEYDKELCFACALHFAGDINGKDGETFGISDKKNVVAAVLHVYAPSNDWNYDPAYPEYVNAVCLRCTRFDVQKNRAKVSDFVKGHGTSWYYVATKDEIDNLTGVTDKELLKTNFDKKAKNYDGQYVYTYAKDANGLTSAATKGGVVELAENLGDVTLTSSLTASGKDLEVDLNGNTIKAATVADNKGSVEVGNNGTLTIKGGTIESASTNVIAVTTGALVLEDVTVNATKTSSWGINVNGSEATHVTLKNSTVISAGGAFTVNGSFEGQSIELENCTFLGSTIGIYMAGNAVTTATNCVFYGTVTAADICSGDITFNGCTFANSNFFYGTGTPEAEVPSNFFSGNGSTFPRACSATIVVDAKAGYKKPIALKFTGTSTWINTAMPSYIDAAWKYKVSDMLPGAPDETHTEAFKNALGETIGYYAKATKPYEKICVAVVEPGEYTETRVSINTNVDLGLKLGTNVLVYTSNGSKQQPAEQATIAKVEDLQQLVTVTGCRIAEKA